jgi:CheY-like chemotaxis protein
MPGTILIADDNEAIRSILKMTLEFGGYRVEEAVDGRQAFERLSQGSYALLISDIDMPHVTGHELLDKVRTELGALDLPVIICTAELKIDRNRLIERGANLVLRKPVPPTALLEAVAGLIGKAGTD